MRNTIIEKSSLFNSKAEYVVSGLELFVILTVTAFQTHTMIFASSANNIWPPGLSWRPLRSGGGILWPK